jgi:hypothetical protein
MIAKLIIILFLFFVSGGLLLTLGYLYNKAKAVESGTKKNNIFYLGSRFDIGRFPFFMKDKDFLNEEAKKIISIRNKCVVLFWISIVLFFYFSYLFDSK